VITLCTLKRPGI